MPPLLITAVEPEGFHIYLEPEGAEHLVEYGARISVVFPPGSGKVALSWVSSGLVICRDTTRPDYPTLNDESGKTLDW